MKKHEADLSHGDLLATVRYEPETGEFYWLVRKQMYGGIAKPGDLVKGTPNVWGYKVIGINRRRYIASRLAWFYVHGTWPVGEVDHANMDIDDNRIANLRDTTKAMQRGNQRVRTDSKSGIKGVDWHRGRWRARRAKKTLGSFATKEEAAAAYKAAALRVFGEFARFE